MTREALNKLSEQNLGYLSNLRDTATKAQDELTDTKQRESFIEQIKATARGYIRCLIDTKVLSENDFRFVWGWFTTGINYPVGKGV